MNHFLFFFFHVPQKRERERANHSSRQYNAIGKNYIKAKIHKCCVASIFFFRKLGKTRERRNGKMNDMYWFRHMVIKFTSHIVTEGKTSFCSSYSEGNKKLDAFQNLVGKLKKSWNVRGTLIQIRVKFLIKTANNQEIQRWTETDLIIAFGIKEPLNDSKDMLDNHLVSVEILPEFQLNGCVSQSRH